MALLVSSHGLAVEPVTVTAAPLLGSEAPSDAGWFSYLARLENHTAEPIHGTVRLLVRGEPVTRAPFALAARTEATVELSWHDLTGSQLAVEAVGSSGRRLAHVYVDGPRPKEPFLFDLQVPSRLLALSGRAVATGYSPPTTYPAGASSLVVQGPFVERATDDLRLPERPPAYGSVTVVHAPSSRLAALDPVQMTALSDWVLAGGTLAVTVSRPEDLRSEPLSLLMGGGAMRVPAPASVLQARSFVTAVPQGDRPGTLPTTTERRIHPSDRLLAELDGYSGGNLRPTRWGATASYGLGEVHLLAFDATSARVTVDPWVEATLLDLVRHAWDRGAHVALPSGNVPYGTYALKDILRLLDPNEGGRWSVAASTVLLICYALLAGPMLFWHARRRGRPLSVLWQLPAAALATLLGVILFGLFAKGIDGRARRLTFVDAGAGSSRARAMRFRALYTPSAEELTVRASDRSNLLDVTATEELGGRMLVSDRDGAWLDDVVTRPWETVLVREDGFIELGGGVSLASADGDLLIANRTGRALVGVLVRTSGTTTRYFARIDDGAHVRARRGEPVELAHLQMSSGQLVTPLGVGGLGRRFEQASHGLGAAWSALDQLASNADWWPRDVPVLIAQLHGGEGRLADAGLVVDSDRVLLRVVGYGGVP